MAFSMYSDFLYEITEILLKVPLNTITLNLLLISSIGVYFYNSFIYFSWEMLMEIARLNKDLHQLHDLSV
jgi:hypothetical protein